MRPAPGPPKTETDLPARIRAPPGQTVRRAQRATSVSRVREAVRAGDSVRPAQERALALLRQAARRSSDGWSAEKNAPRATRATMAMNAHSQRVTGATSIVPSFTDKTRFER